MAYLDSDRNITNVRMKRVIFQAEGAAGVYTGSVVVPAGATLVDIVVQNVALWTAGTAAAMIVGDATDPNGFYDAVDLKATDLLAGQTVRFADQGGVAGAYLISTHQLGLYSAAARTITGEITTTGTASSVGTTIMDVYWADPVPDNISNATYAAS